METVKLIEPTYGRIVTLQVLREEPFILDMSIRMLTAIADGEKIKAKVSGNTVTLTFSDVASANAYKEGLKLNQKKSLKGKKNKKFKIRKLTIAKECKFFNYANL